jgi:hypothetical protein
MSFAGATASGGLFDEHNGEAPMTSNFKRGLSDHFLNMLKEESDKGGWWADVLADPKLVIALRGNYLNVYWRGQSLFLVKDASPELSVTTHEKYLLNHKLKSQVHLMDGEFDIASLSQRGFIGRYDGKETLKNLKSVSGLYAVQEKTGCHEIAVGASCVIDCEIAFPGIADPDDGSDEDGSDDDRGRVDLACLKKDGENYARLVFWEAKHYRNPDLRADPRSTNLPPVCRQIQRYENYLSTNGNAVITAYMRAADSLLKIDKKPPPNRSPGQQLIDDAKRHLINLATHSLVLEPKVGLIIFGFRQAERDDPIWQQHLQRLTDNIHEVRARGDAGDVHL